MGNNKLNTEFPGAEKEYHIRLKKGDVSPYVLLPGAPERVDIITSHWSEVENLEHYREFRSARGKYEGFDIACVSTGIGTTSGEICIHELNNIGVHTAVRVGTTGCISDRFKPGDLIIPVAAIRADGTSDCYIGKEFPAVADRDVVNALGEACEQLGFTYGFGIMYSPSSLYIGQGRKIKVDGYWPSKAEHLIEDLQSARVTNSDTDSAGQFIVGYMHEMRMASILSVIAHRNTGEWASDNSGEYRASEAASLAMKILAERDAKKSKYRV